jgi:CheY-like chemotaxis protein
MRIDPDAPNQKSTAPAHSDLRASASREPHRANPALPATMGARVFVVDDEQIIAATVSAILKISGFSATAFTSPIQALESARLESPDLLISDVMMPEMCGVDLALRIKEECPNCKVLLFSGQAATSDLLWKARGLGHDFHLLLKPVHPADLLCEVRNKLRPPTPSFATAQGLSA